MKAIIWFNLIVSDIAVIVFCRAVIKHIRMHHELSFRMPTPDEVRALRLGPGVGVAQMFGISYRDGTPVEVGRTLFAADMHVLTYDFPQGSTILR